MIDRHRRIFYRNIWRAPNYRVDQKVNLIFITVIVLVTMQENSGRPITGVLINIIFMVCSVYSAIEQFYCYNVTYSTVNSRNWNY